MMVLRECAKMMSDNNILFINMYNRHAPDSDFASEMKDRGFISINPQVSELCYIVYDRMLDSQNCI